MTRSFIAEINTLGREVPVRACTFESRPSAWLFPSVGEYPVYDDFVYHQMLEDKLRVTKYDAAVRRHTPGKTVLDIGTGQDAVWAVAAARAGARHVWAVEVIPRAAHHARKVVEQAGFANRITVIEGLSTEVELPEPVDVCVSEIIGTLGGSEGAGAVLRDARERLVRPGGVFIPHRSATTVAALDLDHASSGEPPGFPIFALRYLEDVFNAVGRPFDMRMCILGLQEQSFLSEVAEVETLEFNGSLELEGADHRKLTVTRPGAFHGFVMGMRLWVDENDEPIDSLTQHCSWSPVYAPLSEDGRSVLPGDRIEFEFTMILSDDGVHPDYRIAGQLHASDGLTIPLRWRSAHHDCGFRTTPFYEALFPVA